MANGAKSTVKSKADREEIEGRQKATLLNQGGKRMGGKTYVEDPSERSGRNRGGEKKRLKLSRVGSQVRCKLDHSK